jgi:ActR/RegA family two-component response regulator
MRTTERKSSRKSRLGDCEHKAIFDPPPLFEGEEKSYAQLLREVSRAVMPADFLEKLWVQDFVYHTIEILRHRRTKRDLITVNAYKGLIATLTPLVGRAQAETLAEGWAARKPNVVEEVNKTLASAGLSADSILAQTFSVKLDEIERIEQMAAVAEARRDATLREIDRHQQTLGQKLRCRAGT